jgi:CDP-diacylglycerol---serine O-phosphatidyltransferase
VANHAAAGMLGGVEYTGLILAVTLLLSGLMVSSIRFRSFKEIKPNLRTALFVGFIAGSSALISAKLQPAFVLVWLLGCYVMMGICETMWELPGRLRERAALARESLPPAPPEPPDAG